MDGLPRPGVAVRGSGLLVYPTILDGENERRVVTMSGGITPSLDGFIITGGNAGDAPDDPGHGGGIYAAGAGPAITNNSITNNIGSNTDTGHGAGIYLLQAPASTLIRANTFMGNVGSVEGRGYGAGLSLRSGSATIEGNTFQSNQTGNYGFGGGIHLLRSSAEISDNRFQENEAPLGYGGGIYAQLSDVTFSRNTVLSNIADHGAVTFESTDQITMTSNVVADNEGGVYLRGNATYHVVGTLVHNTIAQNAGVGIQIGLRGSGYISLTLTNNMIVSHTTGVFMLEEAEATSEVTATHTLFYGNDVDKGGPPIASTSEITGSDPRFVDPASWDYRIEAGSPAVDAGIPVPWLTVDIDGDERPMGDGYDVGAYEVGRWSTYLPLVVRSS